MIRDPAMIRDMLMKDPPRYVDIAGSYRTQEFIDKMLHRVPDADCYSRVGFITDHCKDKNVLHLGCRGESEQPSELHGELLAVSKKVYGVDLLEMNCPDFVQMDLEKDDWVSLFKDKEIDIVVASEIIEHLSNAGMFLDNICKLGKPTIITVPNAHCQTQYSWLRVGIEFDNGGHLAKYSYMTMTNMLKKHGFKVNGFGWLEWVAPYYAKGLVFLATPEGK